MGSGSIVLSLRTAPPRALDRHRYQLANGTLRAFDRGPDPYPADRRETINRNGGIMGYNKLDDTGKFIGCHRAPPHLFAIGLFASTWHKAQPSRQLPGPARIFTACSHLKQQAFAVTSAFKSQLKPMSSSLCILYSGIRDTDLVDQKAEHPTDFAGMSLVSGE